MITKTCSKCNSDKPIEGFYKHTQTRDGYHTICADCTKARAKAWSQKNKEKRKQISKSYTERNPEKRKETSANYYKENKQKISESTKRSRKNNPELYAELGRKHANLRRARKLGNGAEPYTEKEMLKQYGTDCHLCGIPIDFTASRQTGRGSWEMGLQIDHLIPLSKGGPDTLENIRPSHGMCNLKKNNSIK